MPANPPKDFIGGVGSFNVERLIDDTAIVQGEVFKLILTVEGTGNLQNLEVPDLILPKGFVVYGDPTVTENFVITANGADGSVDYEYNIQATNFGNHSIPGTSIRTRKSTSEFFLTKWRLVLRRTKNFKNS